VTERIEAAARRAGRRTSDVEILPVTKGHPARSIEIVKALGVGRIGENRVPEAEAKRSELGPTPGVAWHLIGRLPHYEVLHRLDEIPKTLAGQHPRNPCNLPRNGGVQIELPPRIRGKSPMWTGFRGPGRVPHHEALIEGLAAAARAWTASEDSHGAGRELVPEPALAD